ncbi:YopX family protein [Chryseobacterium oncorhynchi]|uniref:YopX protein domain-containing protein n=1 Tax=Chryseobacterium oncorhynchi TaxID=741074 RepID=A0A316WLN2_9FLAO|nr:YopX family protein [Chryseobacterium oncorhynchi]PWN62324.1 hypothetical protein C1638_017685 [Chryseobacterium oncorhynchi]
MQHREIEFKAINANYYNLQTGGIIEWSYGYYAFMRMPGTIDNGLKGNHRIFSVDEEGFPIRSSIVIPETICQFTGLKDKNKVKIFESDIISDGIENYEVKYIWSSFKILKGRYYVDFVEDLKNMQVIGNWFETPELLK